MTSRRDSGYSKLYAFCVTVIAILSVAQTVYVRRLSRTTSLTATSVGQLAPGAPLARGDKIPEIIGVGLNGYRRSITLASSSQKGSLVLAIGRRLARVADLDPLRSLATSAARKGMKVIWVSAASPEQTASIVGPTSVVGDLLADPPRATWLRLRLGQGSRVVVLKSDATVIDSWPLPIDEVARKGVLAAIAK